MKIRITTEFDDFDRRAFRFHWGREGKATRREIGTWMQTTIESAFWDLAAKYEDYVLKENEEDA